MSVLPKAHFFPQTSAPPSPAFVPTTLALALLNEPVFLIDLAGHEDREPDRGGEPRDPANDQDRNERNG
jgi:hypothetical protein